MTQITEEVRDQLLEASAATRKAYSTYRREADSDDHYSAAEGAQSAADKSKDDLEMSAVISIMQPILRFLQLLCENHNRDLQVSLIAEQLCPHRLTRSLQRGNGTNWKVHLNNKNAITARVMEAWNELPLGVCGISVHGDA